eukprot:g46658.t1
MKSERLFVGPYGLNILALGLLVDFSPDDSMMMDMNGDESDSDLEAELAEITGEKPASRGKPKGKVPLPMEDIERMAALCMKDLDEEADDDVDDDADLMPRIPDLAQSGNSFYEVYLADLITITTLFKNLFILWDVGVAGLASISCPTLITLEKVGAELNEVLEDDRQNKNVPSPVESKLTSDSIPQSIPTPAVTGGLEGTLVERIDMYRSAIDNAKQSGESSKIRRYE